MDEIDVEILSMWVARLLVVLCIVVFWWFIRAVMWFSRLAEGRRETKRRVLDIVSREVWKSDADRKAIAALESLKDQIDEIKV